MMGKTRQILSTCFFSSKNVHIINNDGEHKMKIEDHEADSRI